MPNASSRTMSGDQRRLSREPPSGGSSGVLRGSGGSARSLGLPFLPPTNPAKARQLQERLLVPPGVREQQRAPLLQLPRAAGASAAGKKPSRPIQLSPLLWPGQSRSEKRSHGCASYEAILKSASKKPKTKSKLTSSVAFSARGNEQRQPSSLSSVGAGAASESSGTSASTELSAGSVQLDEVPQDVACIIDKVRKDARVGFFYLVASVPTYAVERHYYCLKVAPYSAIDPEEYFTISKHGVTHVLNKEADFVPLVEWERDFIMFQKLAKIRTFRQFRMWKQFNQWRENVRWYKFHLAQRGLSRNLFILQPCLRGALLAVRHLCNAVATLGVVDIDDTTIYTLEKFTQAEAEQLSSVQSSLSEFRGLVGDVVQTACNAALLEAGFPTEEYIEELALAVKCGQTVWKTKLHLEPQQCLAMFKVGEYSQQMSFTEQADKRRQCQRLTRFIYTIDLILMTCKHLLVKNTTCYVERALSARVERIPPPDELVIELATKPAAKTTSDVGKKHSGPNVDGPPPPEPSPSPEPDPMEEPETPAEPLFLTALEFRGAVPRLVPPLKEFSFSVEKLLTDSREMVENMENLFTDDSFMFITRPTINGKTLGSDEQEGPDLEDVLDSDEQLAVVYMHITQMVTVGFQAAETYIQTFEHVKDWFYENMRTDMTTFADIGCDLDVFGMALAKFTSQMNEVKNIPPERKLGVFCVQATDVRDMVRPSPENCLEQIHKIMPTVTKARVESLMQESQDAHYKLEITPATTEEYVTFLTFLDDISIRIESLEQEADVVCQMMELMEDYQTPIPPEYIAEFNTLSPTVAILHDLTDNCVSDRDACVDKLSGSLTKDIKTLIKDVEVVTQQINDPVLLQMEADHDIVRQKLTTCTEMLRKHETAASTLKDHQKKFRLEVTKLEQLENAQDELRLRTLLWDSLNEWDNFLNETLVAPFNDLDVEELTMLVAKFNKTVVQLEKGLPPNNVAAVLKAKVDDFRIKLVTIADLRNETLRRRHWEAIERQLGHQLLDLDEQTPLTLQLLIDYQAFSSAEQIKEVSGQASSEASLETLLGKVEAVWKSTEFSVVPLSGQKDVYILGGTDDIQQLLDESNINIQTISSSRHVGPIRSRVEDWEKRLDLFAKTLEEWLTCQRIWLYLGSVFCAPDIQRQLPTEAKLFITVDKSYKDIMRRVYKVPLAIRAATQAGMVDALQTSNGLLDQIMKCLEAYLESKRVVFPRFYFLSNDELLEILAQTRNPQAVEPHLKKCFDAIHKLEFGTKENAEGQIEISNEILAMLSPEKEHVPLTKGLKARGNVEDWLGKVEEAMFTSLRRAMKQALLDYAEPSKEAWVISHPSQVVLTVSQIVWCRDVHAVLDGDHDRLSAMKAFEDEMFQNLTQLATMVRGELKDLERNVLCALITLSVHSRDIISGLVLSECDSSGSFEWLKQLRYYWAVQADTCEAAMSLARHTYGFEYLGASPRLVITPLTDRCYLCLMGALQLDLGGAPAGPAGTGKTETTKDLAKSLAIQCVVFNCSEGIDYKMMGRFFSGLAQSGAWCCFDEFNRIDIEVLSVIAQQLITIRGAKVIGAQRFMFEGREIKLVRSCAAFITMNPGYAGRTELPDNLKALFRPISMMVPDYGLIAEVILYSEGFESSKNLARKMVHLFRLCSEQLSQQSHYDFGMRALKSVLVMAGRLKRENPQINEDIVLIRALRDANVPKFLSDDLVLFKAILDDLFPGAVIPEIDYGQLKECIIEVMISMKMQAEPCQIRKVIQFHETMIVRHGVMLVGPSGGGKTTVYKILQKSLTKMLEDGHESPYYQVVHVEVLNPKAITMGELYGEVNLLTLEWRDGILGRLIRGAVSDTTEDQHWIVFDGPVDAVWIENMNTVLDDNKLLCLTNSERIKLTPGVRMVFEVDDLAQASPATVSRCGMVFVDPGEMKWLPFVKTWLDDLEETGQLKDYMRAQLQELFERYVEDGLHYVAKSCIQAMPQAEVNKVEMMCRLMTSLMFGPGGLNPVKEPLRLNELLAQTFVFCYLWTVGGNLVEQNRDQFEQFIRKQLEDNAEVKLPTHSDLWSFRMDFTNKKMDPWERIVPPFVFDPEMSFVNIVVPTVDTIRYSYLLDKLLAVNTSVMFTGGTGVGKSIIGRFQLLALGAKIVPVFFNFSANTTSMRAQEVVESKLERRRRTVLAAPAEKKVVVFIDDVNMPRPEIYGAMPPVELLRQLLDFGGLYDRKDLFWKTIQDVVVCAACAPPGGGRHQLNGRFLRHFCMLLIPQPNEATLVHIFRSIVHGFLAGFASPVKALADAIVNSAVEIYSRISLDLLPTPSKSHYIFNLRDLSKCINGVLQADPGVIVDKEPMFRLFAHEAQRVFHDRLVTDDDKMYFNTMMLEVASRNFSVNLAPEVLRDTPILFGDFIKMGAEEDQKMYEEFKDHEKLQRVLQDYLDDYNVSGSREMQLVFFRDAVEHVTRLARILRTDRGNALLVGVGGTGKQSLTRLACHVNNASCFMIALCRGYDHTSFRDDIRQLYWQAGALRNKTVFFFADYQIAQEEFMEDIDSILNSGEVPSLYDLEEYEKVIIASRPFAKQAGIPEGDRDAIFSHFISHVRSNLHIVLSMSPAGEAFRFYCRMFPAVVNCCTIDWFSEWPAEALLEVARKLLKKDEIGDPDLTENIGKMCVTAHQDVVEARARFLNQLKRYYYVTPTSYLELINLYGTMLRDQKTKISGAKERISNGLLKLNETNSLVDTMSVELVALAPELKKKSADTELLMERLSKDQGAADKVREVVQVEEAAAKIKAEETQTLADDAQKDLDEALPALEGAVKALDSLDKSDISEIKVFNKPPEMVQIVLEAVCILLGAKTDWATAKQVLSDNNFLRRLMEYDKENIPDTVLRKIKKYIDDPKFVPEVVEKVSKACKSMCLWVRAIDLFARIFKEVEPKRARLQAAEVELASVMATLKEKQDRLAAVEAQIAELQSLYDHSVGEKQSLEDKIAVTSARLTRASKLTSALADEGERWAINVETLDGELKTVVGNMFMGAASVSYLGAFTSQFREDLLQHWIEMCQQLSVPIAANFSLSGVLADPYQIRQWNACGLPRDDVSTLNAILSTRSRRWPLMIDPQDQANQWIRRMEAADGLKVAKMSDPLLLRVLETCIRLGMPMLIEAVGETLDAALEPILLRQTYLSGGRLLIKLGDSEVDYDKSFRLYMTTKLGNPHYLPEVCIKVTLVNFTVTQSGLEDQLLGDVVRLEEPKIEETRNKLIVQINADKAQLRSIEDKILYMLFTSEGNILDNEQLILTLNESKITSRDISIRLTEAESTEVKISAAREKYRPVAMRGSIVYFVIAQLAEVDAMYQYSLKYFNQIFTTHIESTRKSPDLEEHLANLIENTTVASYTDVARGLFEKDKLIFSFVLCVDIMRQRGSVTDPQWNFVLRGAPHLADGLGDLQSPVKWFSDSQWKELLSLEVAFPDEFSDFPNAIIASQIAVTIGNETFLLNPEAAEPAEASDWNDRLTSMQRLLAVRSTRQEQLSQAVTEFVRENLGGVFIERPAIDLPTLFPNIDRYTPLIFVLSQGTDPMGEFMAFTRDRLMDERVSAISLGQGQGPVAESAISQAVKNGDWVFLQNCHLSASWMPCLETIIKDLPEAAPAVHESFRLFLSSMPAKAFPVEILQNSVKVTNEPPRGLRNSLRQAFAAITTDFFDDNPLEISWRRMVFGLCFFHAVIQERKKYGPLGWNIGYEFTTTDREFALDNLRLFCQDAQIPWEALQYITGQITYGGRVTDNWDQRCLTTVLKNFFSPAAMDDEHKYSPSGTYYAPTEGALLEYRRYIDNLPVVDSPEIFGMHVNADVVSKVQETHRLLGTILSMQPWLAASAGGEGSGDQFVYDLAETMEGRIPTKIDMELAHKKLFQLDSLGRMNSLTTVLVQEVDRYNRLLKCIHSTLNELKRAIRGLVVMSEELDRVYKAFVNNQVPALWGRVGYLSVKSLGSWVNDLILRVDAFADWSRFGPPTSFWFSGFFFPQGFLTGVLQNFARKHTLPIDQLRFQYNVQTVWRDQADILKWRQELSGRDGSAGSEPTAESGPFHRPASGSAFISWLDDELTVPDEGLLVHGLFIDAGRWDMDNMALTDPMLGEMRAVLPVLHVLPAFNHVPDPQDYTCPLYRTPVRAGILSTTGHSTNFVVDIQLPCDQPEEHWITQGTALLTLLQD